METTPSLFDSMNKEDIENLMKEKRELVNKGLMKEVEDHKVQMETGINPGASNCINCLITAAELREQRGTEMQVSAR
tara:strand:- start:541 stop:771 length:231 start_codon:yes stop_codon:yes gene_type:complete